MVHWKKCILFVFDAVIYQWEICFSFCVEMNVNEIFMENALLMFWLQFSAVIFRKSKSQEMSEKALKSPPFLNYHNNYFGISERIAYSIIHKIIYLHFFNSFIRITVQFRMKKNAFYNNKELQLKNNLLLFPETFTQNIFFSAVTRKKMNEWKFSDENMRVLLNGKKSISSHPRSILMLCDFLFPTLVIRDFDLIRWKKYWKISTKLFFTEK